MRVDALFPVVRPVFSVDYARFSNVDIESVRPLPTGPTPFLAIPQILGALLAQSNFDIRIGTPYVGVILDQPGYGGRRGDAFILASLKGVVMGGFLLRQTSLKHDAELD